MAKYKRSNYSQTVFLQVSLSEQLIPGTIEFTIHSLVESRIDFSQLDSRYRNDQTGSSAYDPRILLKIVLYGYSLGIISCRKIEKACRQNMVFMALSGGQHPDHSKIADFVSSPVGWDHPVVQECAFGLWRDAAFRGNGVCVGWFKASIKRIQKMEWQD